MIRACRLGRRVPAEGFWKFVGLGCRCQYLQVCGGGAEGVHVLVDHEPDVGSLQGGIAGADEGLFGGFWGGG